MCYFIHDSQIRQTGQMSQLWLPWLSDFLARVERFELPSTVLETAILPLNYTRKKAKSYQPGLTAFSNIRKYSYHLQSLSTKS